MQRSVKDLIAGLVFIAFGAAFAYAAFHYPLGTALRMGPGYFPLVLAGVLFLLGVGVIVEGFAGGDASALGPVPWRAIFFLTVAILFFGFTVRRLGLAPALFAASFLAGLSSSRNGLLSALALAAGLTAFCIVIFWWALGMPVRLIGPWLGFLGLSV
jgi:hypothetical protein